MSRVLGCALGGVVALLLPSLLIPAPDATGLAALAVASLALCALVRFGPRRLALVGSSRGAVPASVGEAIPVSPGRVTDPTHHPLRPRAPGLA